MPRQCIHRQALPQQCIPSQQPLQHAPSQHDRRQPSVQPPPSERNSPIPAGGTTNRRGSKARKVVEEAPRVDYDLLGRHYAKNCCLRSPSPAYLDSACTAGPPRKK
ncbi:hypothetical protein PAXINDRAFT_17290 [Paxillus involutus ATCC 200175]|uniref:Uncharacterized protein n=1 Tax=Paxillus involutus ATCC 200175 TaxID=664439 RepID=A0A0C9TPC9_PAXIN|nr:hypothetical protein PAXINDRAFT_17290 [Paxillus involutus ATCC 200175]